MTMYEKFSKKYTYVHICKKIQKKSMQDIFSKKFLYEKKSEKILCAQEIQ